MNTVNKKRNHIIIAGILILLVLFVVIILKLRQNINMDKATDATLKKQGILTEQNMQQQNADVPANPSPKPYVEERSLYIRVGMDKKVDIPDPATATGKVTVSLIFQREKDIKIHGSNNDNWEWKWSKKSIELYPNYLADLSFAGFEKPVFVSSYIVGDMTGEPDTVSYISKKTKNGVKEQEVSGSCLALMVTTGVENLAKLGYDDVFFHDTYFVILDYKNGTYYKVKTGFFLPNFHAWIDLYLADITGDGVQELVVNHAYNTSEQFGIYHANAGTHKIKEIYSSFKDFKVHGEFIDCIAFKGNLKDNYKAELRVPCIGYSKTISIIKDAGYKKSQLQNKYADKYNSIINYVGMWKNGKLRKKWAKKHGKVFLYTLDHVSWLKNKEGKMQIEFVRSICLGHRSESLGDMYTYLEYDKKMDTLVVKGAKYLKDG